MMADFFVFFASFVVASTPCHPAPGKFLKKALPRGALKLPLLLIDES
jgi:hypothetical protein